MDMQLISPPRSDLSTLQQILFNRGLTDTHHYLNLTDADICDFKTLGVDDLEQGAKTLINIIMNWKPAVVIVDCDADGYTSAALLINYLHRLFPKWVETCITFRMHDSKQHGLIDHIDWLEQEKIPLVICPDSSSNDYSYHARITQYGGQVLILDHHLADKKSEHAITINNQLSDYPNKELSGVGVTWQFCRYLDSLMGKSIADSFLDLVALGLCGDMMSLKSYETRYLITKGFRKENIKNPFIEYMLDKNSFPLSKADYKTNDRNQACTNMGAAFFIVPFINAITRSGTLAEKELIFKSMLEQYAFQYIPEIKRNKNTGRDELLVLQAVRVISNVKNRQTRAENAGLELLESRIKINKMLDHKILLFVLKPNEIPSEIRGLIANKMMAKYQRPCIILTNHQDTCDGSMRGYTKNGLLSFKELLEQCPGVVYVQGHDNAAGISIETKQLQNFLITTDKLMETISAEPIYRIDYFFKECNDKTNQIILDIASMNDYWGQDVDRAYVGIRFKIFNNNFFIMKSNTLKIKINDSLSLIKFNGTEKDIETFTTQGWVEVEAYCKCNCNEWNGFEYPQLLIEDYKVIDSCKYIF